MQDDATTSPPEAAVPGLPYVEQERARSWGVVACAPLLMVASTVGLDPWWELPLVYLGLLAVALPVWWGFARVATGSWLDEVERVDAAPDADQTSAARRSGRIGAFRVLCAVVALCLLAWPLVGSVPVAAAGAFTVAAFAAVTDVHAARAWEVRHDRRLYVRVGAGRRIFTRTQQVRRLVAAPHPVDH